MTMLFIQALLWLLIAFLLGYWIGRFLKSLFCKDQVEEDVYPPRVTAAQVDGGRVGIHSSGISAKTASALGGAAAAAGAAAVARNKLDETDLPEVSVKAPSIDLSGIDPHKPIVDPPDLDVDLPKVSVKAPSIDLSGIDPHKPIVDPPDLDVDLPEVDVNLAAPKLKLPEVDVKGPSIDLASIDPHKPIVDPPDLDVDLPEAHLTASDVKVESGVDLWDMAKGAVVAAGAGLAAKATSAIDFDKIDPHKPIVDPPDLEVDLPEVDVKAPSIDLSGIDPHKPIVDLPDLDVDLPEVDVKVPSIDLSGIDPHKPIVDPPDLDVDLPEAHLTASDVKVESGVDLWDMAKGAVVAAGAGLAAKATSAIDFSKIDPHKPIVDPPDLDLSEAVPAAISSDRDEAASTVLYADDKDKAERTGTNWLSALVQRIKDEYQGHNPRAVSKLWNAGSNAYDCSALDEYESLTLHPAQYDKLGIIHCGVPHAGFVAVGGDVSSIAPGEAVFFHYPGIVVCRDDGDNHHFVRIAG